MAALELINTTLFKKSSLQAYYRLENNLTDSSPASLTLTDHSSTDTASGMFGHARHFTQASDQYATLAAANSGTLRITGAQTWMGWFYLDSLGAASNHKTVAGVWDAAAAHSYVLLKASEASDKYCSFNVSGLTPSVITSSTSVPSTGAWTFICGRYNGSNELALWVNSTKYSVSVTGSQTWNGDEGFGLGSFGLFHGTTVNMDGSVDDFAIFNEALTDTEITNHYNGLDRASSGGFFPFF